MPVKEKDFIETEEKASEKEEIDWKNVVQRKPPKEGTCRRCGQKKPVNRLMLCYPCWVKTVLEEKYGWKEGLPHPSECDCEIPGTHPRPQEG